MSYLGSNHFAPFAQDSKVLRLKERGDKDCKLEETHVAVDKLTCVKVKSQVDVSVEFFSLFVV